MTTLKLSDELAQELQHEAQTLGLPIEDFLKVMLRRERTLAARRKIEHEQTWWLSQPLSQRAKYEGQWVAVHQQALIDADPDEMALSQRIRATYGDVAVLMMPAEGPREIRIFSPQLVAG